MDYGYIKLHRKMIDWEWYNDINTKILFLHLLLKANWEEKQWQWITIERWEIISSIEHLSKETWLTTQKIRTSINKLKSTGEITSKSTSKYTLFKLKNYDSYQTEQQTEQQTSNKQITTTKELKELKEKNKQEILNFSNLWKENKSMMSSYLMFVFLDLWFVPSKTETVESFKLWFKEKILDTYKIDNTSQIKSIIDNYHTYWLEIEKKPSNYKTSFMNNPLFNKLK